MMSLPYIIVATLCFSLVLVWALRAYRGLSIDRASNDDSDGGLKAPTMDPVLDLPPGITLPTSDEVPQYAWSGAVTKRALHLV